MNKHLELGLDDKEREVLIASLAPPPNPVIASLTDALHPIPHLIGQAPLAQVINQVLAFHQAPAILRKFI